MQLWTEAEKPHSPLAVCKLETQESWRYVQSKDTAWRERDDSVLAQAERETDRHGERDRQTQGDREGQRG